MKELGVDLVDVSTGGNWVEQKIPIGSGFQVNPPFTFPHKPLTNFPPYPLLQVPFAARIKHDHPTLAIGTVGLITDPHQANSYIKDGEADVVFLARELLRRPDWPLWAAQELGAAVEVPNPYERAWMQMLGDPRKN